MGKEGFNNPIVAASGTLIRLLMKSVNYVAGVAGWQITRDGNAEFNDVTLRGELLVADATTEAEIHIWNAPGIGPTIELLPRMDPGHTRTSGNIVAGSNLGEPILSLTSPTYDGGGFATLELQGAYAGNQPTFTMLAGSLEAELSLRATIETPITELYNLTTGHMIARITETDGMVAGIPGTSNPEVWNAMVLTGLWTNFGGAFVTAQYRKLASPGNSMQIVGVCNTNGGFGAGTVMTTFPVGYRPLKTIRFPVTTANPGARTPSLEINAAGQMSVLGLAAIATTVEFNAIIPLDA